MDRDTSGSVKRELPEKQVRVCPRCGGRASGVVLDGLCARCVAETMLESSDAHWAAEAGSMGGPPGGKLGQYELLELVGRGGMGVVYRARQAGLNRIVALKLLSGGVLADAEARARFQQEGMAAAALCHPNIVSVHEIGEEGGQPFICMDFLDGPTLAQLGGTDPIPPTRAAEIVLKLAGAVHFAHEAGIVHRDLKPSNVILDELGEPMITDFGLARILGGESGLTLTGQVLGSPNFLPPEQAAGNGEPAGVGGDVYSLGAILYFLLTARPPHVADTLEATLAQVVQVEPVKPRLLNPGVPADLETITLKCLEKRPAHRYASARLLAEELSRFLAGEPIEARPLSPLQRGMRWCRRNPQAAGLALLAGVLMAGLSIGAPLAAIRIDRERKRAEQNAAVAVQMAARERRNLYAADMLLTQQALSVGNLRHALDLLERHANPDPRQGGSNNTEDLRGWEWRHFWRQTRSGELFTLGNADHSVLELTFAPNDRELLSGTESGQLACWDLERRALRAQTLLSGRINSIVFGPAGSSIATGGMDPFLRIFTYPSLNPKEAFRTQSIVRAIAFAGAGDDISMISQRHWARWKVSTGELRQSGEVLLFARAAFSPDGRWMALPQADGTVNLADSATGAVVHKYSGHIGFVLPVAFSNQGRWLASGGFDGVAQIHDLPARKLAARLTTHQSVVSALAFTPDDSVMVTGSYDGTIKVWRTRDWSEISTLKGHVEPVWALAVSMDGRRIASGDKQGGIKLWAVDVGAEVENLPGQAMTSRTTRGADHLVEGVQGGAWRLWDLRDSPVSRSIEVDGEKLFRNVYTRNRGFVLETADGRLIEWSGAGNRGVPLVVSPVLKQGTFAPVFFGAGRFCITGLEEGNLQVFDLQTHVKVPLEKTPSLDQTLFAAGSDDGNLLIVSAPKDGVYLYSVGTGRLLASREPEKFAVASGLFSRDNRFVYLSSEAGVVKVLLTEGLKSHQQLRSRADAYWSVALSPDGTRLAAGSGNGTVALWDLASGLEVAHLRCRLPGMVLDLNFNEDGTRLIAGNSLTIWEAATDVEIRSASKGSKKTVDSR